MTEEEDIIMKAFGPKPKPNGADSGGTKGLDQLAKAITAVIGQNDAIEKLAAALKKDNAADTAAIVAALGDKAADEKQAKALGEIAAALVQNGKTLMAIQAAITKQGGDAAAQTMDILTALQRLTDAMMADVVLERGKDGAPMRAVRRKK